MNIQEIVITIVVGVMTAAITFYLKDFLLKKQEYSKLRQKLEKIAGKNATVIYGDEKSFNGKDEIYKIVEIGESGVILENELKTIFIPTAMLLSTQMVLPSSKYSTIMREREIEQEKRMAKLFMEEMKSTMPSMVEPLSKETREFYREMLEELSNKKDSITDVLSALVQTGSLQPPDPTRLLALRLAKLLTSDSIIDQDKRLE